MNLEHVQAASDFARKHLFEMAIKRTEPWIDPIYRWQHVLRVTQYGVRMAREENANEEQVVMACLLHDIAHFDDPDNYIDHGRLGATIVRPFLQELGYGDEDVAAICFAIALHVDGKADFEYPHELTLEASVVSDADNIDRFGAYRILQYCYENLTDFDMLITQLEERLPTLREYRTKDMLDTASGNALFNVQLDRQISFFEAVLAEKELTMLIEG